MIIYRHPLVSTGTPSAPQWLDGAPAIVYSENQTHRLAGIGEDYQMGDRPEAAWRDVGEGWEAVRVLPDTPILLHRRLSWARSRVVADAEGRQWQAPVLLTPQGGPGVICAYGDNWLPVYTSLQERLLDIAECANAALQAREVPMQAACQWAAEALAAANHITVQVIQRLNLLDSHLVQNVLLAMTGTLDAAELAQDGNHG